jgi:hypothetical protein
LIPRYGHKSDPQMHVTDVLMIASVGRTIFGSSSTSNRMSRGPNRTAPRIVIPFLTTSGSLQHCYCQDKDRISLVIAIIPMDSCSYVELSCRGTGDRQ